LGKNEVLENSKKKKKSNKNYILVLPQNLEENDQILLGERSKLFNPRQPYMGEKRKIDV
jgi:hypothetical protein